jgi:hypothetical protein
MQSRYVFYLSVMKSSSAFTLARQGSRESKASFHSDREVCGDAAACPAGRGVVSKRGASLSSLAPVSHPCDAYFNSGGD